MLNKMQVLRTAAGMAAHLLRPGGAGGPGLDMGCTAPVAEVGASTGDSPSEG